MGGLCGKGKCAFFFFLLFYGGLVSASAFSTKNTDPLNLAIESCNETRIQATLLDFPSESFLSAAERYRYLGYNEKAIEILCVAVLRGLAAAHPQQARVLGSLGQAYFMMGEADKAAGLLEGSVTLAKAQKDSLAAATGLNNLGNLYSSNKMPPKKDRRHKTAAAYYQESAEIADQISDEAAAVRARINLLYAGLKKPFDFDEEEKCIISEVLPLPCSYVDEPEKAETPLKPDMELVQIVFDQVPRMDRTAQKIEASLRLGWWFFRALEGFSDSDAEALKEQFSAKLFQVFKEARRLAMERPDNPALLAQTLGFLGRLYAVQGRKAEALRYIQQAVFKAQEKDKPEILYYWQWQKGKLLDNPEAALSAYQRSADTLWSVRHDLSRIYRVYGTSFRESVGPVFLELVELQLQQGKLDAVQDTLEKLKAAELADYYQNECVLEAQTGLKEQMDSLSEEGETAAVLYSIVLPDRLELLLYRSGEKTLRKSVDVSSDNIQKAVENFRKRIMIGEEEDEENYEQHARKFYDWLIRPFEDGLEGVGTLIFVPDSWLRLAPMAALLDGETFLIERYALAAVPGLTLVPSVSEEHFRRSVLFAGSLLSTEIEVGGASFNPLILAKDEFNEIKSTIEKIGFHPEFYTLLYADKNFPPVERDENFTKRQLRNFLRKRAYSVVHISSHAFFDSRIENSFIVVGNKEQLFLGEFEDMLNRSYGSHLEPFDMLALSACDTAMGDERAALGLGGIAVRSGVRSALATLWTVEEEVTIAAMKHFYKYFSPDISKARALQEAQTALLKSRNWHHPDYWSPFLLIGDWR